MKKIILLVLCVMLFAMPVVAYAEEGDSTTVETENMSSTEETATEGENSVPEKTITESIVEWIQANYEEISVVITLIVSAFFERIARNKLNGTVGTLNNNAIAIAENSASAIDTALAQIKGIAEVVQGYKDEIATLLTEIRTNAEEKRRLEQALTELENHLKTSKLANVEFANELAELLCLANIPNSKKEELFSRHRAAVASIADAEKTEVIVDVGKEA